MNRRSGVKAIENIFGTFGAQSWSVFMNSKKLCIIACSLTVLATRFEEGL